MKSKFLFFISILSIIFSSCSNSSSSGSDYFSYSEKVNEKFTNTEIQGTWKGILKGADCTCIITEETCTIYANYKNNDMIFNYKINNSMAIHENIKEIDPTSSDYEISSNGYPMIVYFEKNW